MSKSESKTKWVATSAPEALQLLWRDGFFKSRRKKEQVVAELSKKEHNFSGSTLSHALDSSKFLTRNGKKGTYDFIQTFPYHERALEKVGVKKNDKKK
jgi:hypothetical protein